ncbi:MAG TPA: CapA family protein [Candidatus Saccharimonadales bacterium]|nr:CapA family protein [Candidatus Saccharimonadales bacterium]
MKRLPIVLVVGLLAVVVAIPLAGLAGNAGAPATSPTTSGEPGATPAPTSDGEGTGGPSPTVPAEATPSPEPPVVLADVAIVPVTQFRTTATSATAEIVAEVLAGTNKRYDAVELVDAEADAILAALGAERPADADRLVLATDAQTLTKDMAEHRKRLAFLRVEDVTPGVRALAWGKVAMFGNGRVRDLADWPLTATLPAPDPAAAFDPSTTWTMFAGGDIMLDRGVAETLKIKGKGADFPFDGGTVDITGRCKDCSAFGWDLPYTKRTGGKGVVRRLVENADIAIANFENPAPDRFRYHTSGTVFSADPKLIRGLATAGIDWVSLANNHIRDAGGNGILQTIENLDDHGIASGGAGKDLAAAREPSILEANGTSVAILAYDTIARSYTANEDRAGSARLTAKTVKADVKKARDAGAELVIVFPHWGTEYDPTPFGGQRKLAKAAIDAGADIVIGNHAHWAGAMEVYKGKPIWYALGNFIFDQTWSEPTMEGITLELTFHGPTLVQARMRPHLILDKAQPNLLDPAGDGRVVMGQIWQGSDDLDLLPW